VARTSSGLDHVNTLTLPSFRIRFFDPLERYIANAPYRVGIAGETIEDHADEQGWTTIEVQDIPDSCSIEWGFPTSDAPPALAASLQSAPAEPRVQLDEPDRRIARDLGMYQFSLNLTLGLDTMDDNAQAQRRLLHLGYPSHASPSDNLKEFQGDYALAVTGNLTPETKAKLWEVHDDCQPMAFDESSRASPTSSAN